MDVLVVNAGSSSLKLSLLNPADKVLAATEVEHWDTGGPPAALTSFLDGLPGGIQHAGLQAAGPRVDDQDAAGHRRPGQTQSRISGRSSPTARV